MSSRRRQVSNPLERKTDDSVQSTWDKEIYGAIEAADADMQTAYGINIYQITPDPRQPRRQIPSVIRQQWIGRDMAVLFGIWINQFAVEKGIDYDRAVALVNMLLRGEETLPADLYQHSAPNMNAVKRGVIEQSLMAVVNLAAEIQRDGLLNPITIARIREGEYQIETGERRWLAYHMLNLVFGEQWERIPAREVRASNVWRQASENTAREQLNAISMARQLAILLMDLHGFENFKAFEDVVSQGESDRAYYAQVADGMQFRVPRGKGEQLVSAMGIKNPVQLRQYRDLLRIPDEVWMAADDLNWPEQRIRDMATRAVNTRHFIELAKIEAEKDGYIVTIVTVSDDAEGEGEVENVTDAVDEQPIHVGESVVILKDDPRSGQFYTVKDIEKTRWGVLYSLHYEGMSPDSYIKARRDELKLIDPAPSAEQGDEWDDWEPAVNNPSHMDNPNPPAEHSSEPPPLSGGSWTDDGSGHPKPPQATLQTQVSVGNHVTVLPGAAPQIRSYKTGVVREIVDHQALVKCTDGGMYWVKLTHIRQSGQPSVPATTNTPTNRPAPSPTNDDTNKPKVRALFTVLQKRQIEAALALKSDILNSPSSERLEARQLFEQCAGWFLEQAEAIRKTEES